MQSIFKKIVVRGIDHGVDFTLSTVLVIFTLFLLNNHNNDYLFSLLYYFVVYAIVKFIYYFGFEVVFSKTPGKFITQSQVVAIDYSKPKMYTLALRTICRAIPFNEISVFILKGNTFHDNISRTDVCRSADAPLGNRLNKTVNFRFCT